MWPWEHAHINPATVAGPRLRGQGRRRLPLGRHKDANALYRYREKRKIEAKSCVPPRMTGSQGACRSTGVSPYLFNLNGRPFNLPEKSPYSQKPVPAYDVFLEPPDVQVHSKSKPSIAPPGRMHTAGVAAFAW